MTLTDTNDRRIGIVLLLFAALVLAWVIYDLWQRGMNLTQGAATQSPSTSLSVPEPVKNPYSIGEIVTAHIFGEKRREVAAKPKVVEQKKVEKTRLRLRLLGLVSAQKDGMARALISAENGRLQSYGVGEQIENTDSSVHSIEEMRVLLDRDGRLESLEMTRPALNKQKAGKNGRPSANRTASRNQPPQQQQQFNDDGNFAEQQGQGGVEVDYPPDQIEPAAFNEGLSEQNGRVQRLPEEIIPGDNLELEMNRDFGPDSDEPGVFDEEPAGARTVAPKFPF